MMATRCTVFTVSCSSTIRQSGRQGPCLYVGRLLLTNDQKVERAGIGMPGAIEDQGAVRTLREARGRCPLVRREAPRGRRRRQQQVSVFDHGSARRAEPAAPYDIVPVGRQGGRRLEGAS